MVAVIIIARGSFLNIIIIFVLSVCASFYLAGAIR
jgi:hypothetical protein